MECNFKCCSKIQTMYPFRILRNNRKKAVESVFVYFQTNASMTAHAKCALNQINTSHGDGFTSLPLLWSICFSKTNYIALAERSQQEISLTPEVNSEICSAYDCNLFPECRRPHCFPLRSVSFVCGERKERRLVCTGGLVGSL